MVLDDIIKTDNLLEDYIKPITFLTVTKVIQKEIQEYMNKHLDLLLSQTKSYLPFIKMAFPSNLTDACFNLIVGNAFSVFLGQYAMHSNLIYTSPFSTNTVGGKSYAHWRDQSSFLDAA